MSEHEPTDKSPPEEVLPAEVLPDEETPVHLLPVELLPEEAPREDMTARQAYNVVSDTVSGVNVRMRDNLLQAAIIFFCLVLGVGIGFLSVRDRATGAVLGGFIGLLVGLFGSGIFLMIFRAIQHARGRHD
jgi:hypothetical protein